MIVYTDEFQPFTYLTRVLLIMILIELDSILKPTQICATVAIKSTVENQQLVCTDSILPPRTEHLSYILYTAQLSNCIVNTAVFFVRRVRKSVKYLIQARARVQRRV